MENLLKIMPIEVLGFRVSEDNKLNIYHSVLNNDMPNEYIINADEVCLFVNKKEMTLKVIERRYGIDGRNDLDVDISVLKVCKTARAIGMEIKFEDYLMN